MFREFRGFDLAPRQEKIRRCMDLMPVGDPGDIPVIRQQSLNIIVDLDASKKLGIVLPFQILQLAKTI